MHGQASSMEQVFATLADRHSLNIVKMAYFGLKGSSMSYKGNISKKQFYARLKRPFTKPQHSARLSIMGKSRPLRIL
jgi:hypothetical protein